MSHKIKKFLKTIFLILLLALIGITCYTYQKLKKEGKLDEIFASSNKKIIYTNSVDPYESNKKSNQNSSENNDSNENKFVLEKNNYDNYYNEFNFDNALLMYEGEQDRDATERALNTLIKDADDSLYTKPAVSFINFSGLSNNKISADNLEEYKNVLKEAKKSLKSATYTFTFEYNKIKSIVNKIIITKN